MKQTILITGGTGFLGRSLSLVLRDKYSVVLAGRNNKQNMIVHQLTGCKVLPMDVSNIESVRDIFAEIRPSIIIHAAATKFIDLAERQPMECIDVNVVGSQNIARVAIEKSVGAVIGISTDKAAPPIRNTYGLSKAIMERLFCSMNDKTSTKFVCVRYGNIAWSTGSVLTIWKKMHDENGTIRSTGPEMTRFFCTVHEAVDLISTALDNINFLQGKVLVGIMKSAQIKKILALWVKHKGGVWKKMEGRPGERDDEYLVGDQELKYATKKVINNRPYYVISFNQKVSKPLTFAYSSKNAKRLSDQEILNIINDPPKETCSWE